MASLPDYRVGGAIHIVINNQIGFTTDATLARSSSHCTSAAYMIDAPVFHVNGDDVDAVVAVCKLAVEYRQTFNEDCVVDIVCYRRYGHNSLDDPMITQPLMYKMIKDHPPVITRDFVENLSKSTMQAYEVDFQKSKEYVPDPFEWLSSNWQGMAISDMTQRPYNQTGVKIEVLKKVRHARSFILQIILLQTL